MTAPSVFISYSHKDEVWKERLLPHLGMLQKANRLTIWEDRQIDAGATWYDDIKKAMGDADFAVCLISADYLNSDFCVKEEIPYFLERRKADGMVLIPILIRPCAWTAIDWLKAIQMLPRDGKAVARDFKDDWDTPFTQVAEQILSINEKATRKAFIPEKPRWSPPEKVDVDRLPVTGKELFGRQNELKLLDEAWESSKTNVISFVAWGGVGKSTLINKWREQIAVDNYRGAKRVFAWSFYSQGTGDRVTSADIFIAEALKWFGDPEMANSSASAWDKGGRLAELVQREKTLLLLDGMEPLQSYFDFDHGKIKDPALAVLVTELAKENPGLCVITTREVVTDLADFPTTTQQIDLEQISAEAGRALLRVGGVQGTDAELEQATRDFGSHALALNLLATYLHEIPGHHISNASEIPDLDVLLKEGKHPRRVMSAFAKRFGDDSAEVDLLRILGLFSSPAEKEEIAAVRATPPIPNLTEHLQLISETDWQNLVNKLRHLKLIASESAHRPGTLDAHPLVREHFGKQLKQEHLEAWREGNNRLYECYKASAKELPDTLEEMAPLFAAVLHGCQAGKHQEALNEVYWKRILREQEFFSSKKLGAMGSNLSVLSGLFDPPWSKPVDGLVENIKGFVLNESGFYLRALGRLAEAAQPMQAGLDTAIEQKNWDNAARAASTISELYLTIGDVTQALAYAEQSVGLADKSGNWGQRIIARASLAEALHQVGRLTEAKTAFHEAEEIQNKNQSVSLLYSLRGFQYCALLLSQGDYAEVERRASQTLEWANKYFGKGLGLLDIALDNLTLGRAHLLQSQHEADHPFTESLTYLNHAVDGLRQAGQQIMLPHGLLARAEYYRVTNAFDKAQKDLDEAFSISTRGGMGLHLADCHLGFARLKVEKLKGLNVQTLQPANLPTDLLEAREHVKTAKEMIEKMGYHRRDKEVEEIEMSL
jgi:tetratricopeptide (TPR) repeat protein